MKKQVLLTLVALTVCCSIFAQNTGKNNLTAIQQADKWGCINKTGEMVVEPCFDKEPTILSGEIIVGPINGTTTICNKQGKKIIELTDYDYYFDDDAFQFGWASVQINGLTGIFDENGWVAQPQFNQVVLLDGYAFVSIVDTDDSRNGILLKNGKWFIEPTSHLGFQTYMDSNLCVGLYGLYGILNANGWVVEPKFIHAGQFAEGMIPLKDVDGWGYADKNGNWVIQPRFEEARSFDNGLAIAGTHGKVGYIDKKGNWAILPQFEDARPFIEGLAQVMQNGKCGFINKKGKMVIAAHYTSIGYFSEGLAPVMVDKKWGYINTKDKMVIPPQFSHAEPFYNGSAYVRIDYENSYKIGTIDKQGIFTKHETVIDEDIKETE